MKRAKRRRKAAPLQCRLGAFFRQRELAIEPLESRALLSASALLDGLLAQPALTSLGVTNPSPTGYSPSQIRQAYGFNAISLSGGVQGTGAGQTIAIVDAYDDPNIASDLQAFDQTFGIANPPSFVKVNQNGGSSMPTASASWSEEIALDVEWAHAIAPGANILLVEANSSSLTDLLAAVNTARNASGVSVVSMSWGSSEFLGQTQYDSYFTTPAGHTGITFLASAGDSGAGAMWPAAAPTVVGVGGTSLNLAGGGYSSETAWSGSGGGYSQVESEPSYQRGVQSSGARTVPDVSYDANPNTGVAVYDTMAIGGQSGWFEIGGTSAGAPQWAALIAIADQGRALTGQSTISGGQTALYNLPSTDFHDVTSGSNGYSATAGYDLVTGRGSPVANLVVSHLVSNTTGTTTTTTGSTSSSSSSTTTTTTGTAPTHHHYYYEIVYRNGQWWLIVIQTNASDGSNQTDDAPFGLFQVATALGMTSTPQSATTTAAATQTIDVSAAPAPSMNAGGVNALLIPARSGRAGGPRLALPEQSDSAPTDESAPSEAQPFDPPADSAQAIVPAAADRALEIILPSAIQGDSTSIGPMTTDALDCCIASVDWSLDDVAPLIESTVARWDVDAAALAVGLAIAAQWGRAPADTPSSRRPSRRQQFTRC